MKNFDAKQEQTLVIIKPDGVQRGLIGEVIKRLGEKITEDYRGKTVVNR